MEFDHGVLTFNLENLRVPKKSSTFAPEIRGNTLKA